MRGKLTRPAKDILSNWMKVTGSDLGKYIKEAHNGSLSSHSRVAYVNDFITDASASGSISSTSAGTPSGTVSVTGASYTPAGSNAASDVRPVVEAIDALAFTAPTVALVHNADPVGGLAAAPLYAVVDVNSTARVGRLESNQASTANTVFTTANDGAFYGTGTARATGFVKHVVGSTGVALYVDEADGYKIKANVGTGDFYLPLWLMGPAWVSIKVLDADTSGMKQLYYDDNGADNAKLVFVATDTSNHNTGASIIKQQVNVFADGYHSGTAEAQSFTGTPDTISPTASFTGAAMGGHVHTIVGDSISDINLAVVTAGAGTPTASVTADDHSVTLKLAANDEAESARMDFADQLVFNTEKKPYFEALATFTRDGAAASNAIIGLATNYNSNPDSITKSAWFKIIDTGTAISCVIESDDNTTNTDDQPTEFTIVSGTQYRFAIDFADLNNISFYINDTFVGKTSAGAMTGNLQPYFIVYKASGTSEAELKADLFRVESNR